MKPVYKKYFTTVALVWTGCFILLFSVYILVLAPQHKIRRQIERQLADKKQMLNAAIKASQEETKVKLNEQIEYLRNKSKNFIIDSRDSADLTFDVGKIAEEKKVTSFSIKSQDNRDGTTLPDCKYIAENRIDISFDAEFNQFAAFLNALERHRPVIFVDRFVISPSEQENAAHRVKMNLVVLTRKQQDS